MLDVLACKRIYEWDCLKFGGVPVVDGIRIYVLG